MVCLACLLPLFLVPIVNILPLLFYYIMGKVYRLFGWEYKKPERVPASCPYTPPVSNNKTTIPPVGVEHEPGTTEPLINSVGANDGKHD